MIGIFAGLAAALLFGVGMVLFKKGFDALNDSYAFMLNAILGVVIWVPLALWLGVDWALVATSGLLWFWVFGSAILSEALTLYTLSWGKISVTFTVFSTYPIFTALVSWFVNGEVLSALQLGAIVLTIVGIVLLGRDGVMSDTYTKEERGVLLKSIGIALFSASMIGLSDSYGKFTLEQTGYATFLFCLAFAQPIVAYANIRLRGLTTGAFIDVVRYDPNARRFIGGSFMNIVGLVFLWVAFDLLYAGIASALTSIATAITIILAYFFLKEKVTKLQYVGIAIILVAVYGFVTMGV